jgi:hypothetical protein
MGGYTGNVTLSAAGLPSGSTASFNPATVAVGTTAVDFDLDRRHHGFDGNRILSHNSYRNRWDAHQYGLSGVDDQCALPGAYSDEPKRNGDRGQRQRRLRFYGLSLLRVLCLTGVIGCRERLQSEFSGCRGPGLHSTYFDRAIGVEDRGDENFEDTGESSR